MKKRMDKQMRLAATTLLLTVLCGCGEGVDTTDAPTAMKKDSKAETASAVPVPSKPPSRDPAPASLAPARLRKRSVSDSHHEHQLLDKALRSKDAEIRIIGAVPSDAARGEGDGHEIVFYVAEKPEPSDDMEMESPQAGPCGETTPVLMAALVAPRGEAIAVSRKVVLSEEACRVSLETAKPRDIDGDGHAEVEITYRELEAYVGIDATHEAILDTRTLAVQLDLLVRSESPMSEDNNLHVRLEPADPASEGVSRFHARSLKTSGSCRLDASGWPSPASEQSEICGDDPDYSTCCELGAEEERFLVYDRRRDEWREEGVGARDRRGNRL